MSAALTSAEAIDELRGYTLTRRDPGFIHQHAVDAYAAQTAGEHTKAVTLAFALVGLYLHLERGLTGKEVQRMHIRLAGRRRDWPRFALPADRGTMTAADVLAAAPGAERDRAIHDWCRNVWRAYAHCRTAVIELLEEHLGWGETLPAAT